MSNRPKNNRGLHALDRRRRGLTKVHPGQGLSGGYTKEYRTPEEEPIGARQFGIFLDDDRNVDEVEWVKYSRRTVKWHVVRNYDDAVALVEKCMANGTCIDRMALDYDLGEAYYANPRTGQTFFQWFFDRVKEDFQLPLAERKIKLNKYFFDVQVHSQHPEGRHTLRRLAHEFLNWLEENQRDEEIEG